MSLPSLAAAETAAQTVADFLALSISPSGYLKAAKEVFEQFRQNHNRIRAAATAISIIDSTDAGVSEFIDVTGQGAVLAVGDYFTTALITADLTDNALATAKGGAVAVGDLYLVSGADAVTFISVLAEDFAGMDASLAE